VINKWLWKLAKEMQHLLAFIYEIMENRRKGRLKVTTSHEDEIEVKLGKNEEDRGLKDKRAPED